MVRAMTCRVARKLPQSRPAALRIAAERSSHLSLATTTLPYLAAIAVVGVITWVMWGTG